MKNLKSILKKLTLILLASFMLASSQSLFAMDSDFESESSFSVSDEREIKFVLGQGDNVTEIPLPETFNPNISVYISALVDFSGPEVEIKIDEKSPENIRQLCNEQIIRKLIGYLELVSDGTSQLQLRSDLEDEIPEDFKALAILSDYFGVNNLCEAVASIILDKFITLENLVQFKRDPNLFHNSPDWRVESPDWQYKIISRYRSCLANKFDYKEMHEGIYERSRERKIKQSFSGMFVFVPLENNLLKILKRDNDTGQYVALKTCENVYGYDVSLDGKTVVVDFGGNRGFKILRWNEEKNVFVEHPETYVGRYEISLDGKTVVVDFGGNRGFKILRWNEEKNIFVEHPETYVGRYEILLDGKSVVVKYNFNRRSMTYSLKVLRFDGSKFVEVWSRESSSHRVRARFRAYVFSSDIKTVIGRFRNNELKILRWNKKENTIVEYPETYARGYKISLDGKTVCVKCYLYSSSMIFSLKILRWNEEESQFIESETYENVLYYNISKDFRQVCIGFADGRFKILRKFSEVKNIKQAMFVYLAQKEQAIGGLDLKKPDSGRQKTSELLQRLGSFDEVARSWLVERYKIKV